MSDDTTETATETDESQVDESAETQTEEKATTDDEQLGEAGTKALEAWKTRAKTAEKTAREAVAEAKSIKEAAALKDKPAEEQALEAARAEARTEANTKANERILRSELKALATGKLADPTDAALFISLADFTVDDNGDVDSDALNEAITDLIERKPHLAAQKATRFDGGADQGARKDAQPQQLTQADLDRMVAAHDDDGIAKARADGRFNTLIGIKN